MLFVKLSHLHGQRPFHRKCSSVNEKTHQLSKKFQVPFWYPVPDERSILLSRILSPPEDLVRGGVWVQSDLRFPAGRTKAGDCVCRLFVQRPGNRTLGTWKLWHTKLVFHYLFSFLLNPKATEEKKKRFKYFFFFLTKKQIVQVGEKLSRGQIITCSLKKTVEYWLR